MKRKRAQNTKQFSIRETSVFEVSGSNTGSLGCDGSLPENFAFGGIAVGGNDRVGASAAAGAQASVGKCEQDQRFSALMT